MPKLLQINISVNRGSTGKIAEQIGALAMSCGWESYVAYANYNINSKSHTYKIRGKYDKLFHQAESFLFDRHGLGSKKATLNLIKYIESINPDIIHLHNIHGYFVNYKILFSYLKKIKKPIVWTLHDCWTMTGHCSHFVTANCHRWETECYDCPLKHEYPKSLFVDRCKKNFSEKKLSFTGLDNLTVVSVSEWLNAIVSKSYLSYSKKVVIHNGIDLNLFKPSIAKNQEGKFSIISVASLWNEDKGLNDFIKLRRMLPMEYSIILVGLTEKQIHKLPEGICGICRTENQQALVDLYSSSNVLVNATYADSFPTVNLEALASGTPVITYKTGGSPEAVDDKTGIVVEQGNIRALADAIIKMKNMPLSSIDCRERAISQFDNSKCFRKYIDLYNSILNV